MYIKYINFLYFTPPISNLIPMKENYSLNLKTLHPVTALKQEPNTTFSKAKAMLLMVVSVLLFIPATVLAQTGETCATAINLGTLTSPYSSSTFNKIDNAQPTCATGNSPDLYYSISVPAGYALTIGQTTANYDFANQLFYGSCTNQTFIRCINFITRSYVWQNLTGTAQTVYWLQDGIDGDAGTFTLQWSVTQPPACDIPIYPDVVLTSPSNGTISWEAPNTGNPSGYQYAVTTSATPPATGTATTQLSVANVAVTANATNYLHIRSVCGGTNGNSTWVTYQFYGGYCVPLNTSSVNYYISGITTEGGETNINNTGTGFSGYTDYTATQSVSAYVGGSFTIRATHPAGEYIYGVWVDWNNDYEFTTDERHIFSGALPSPAEIGSVIVPAGTALGQYRMRIRNAFRGAPSPCGNHAWGEAEDYSINVIDAAGCFKPYALTISLSDATHANLNWTQPALGDTPTGYEYVFSTSPAFPVGNGTPTPVNYSSDEDYNPAQSAYLFVRTVCGDGEYSDWETISLLDAQSPEFTAENILVYKENGTLNITSGTAIMMGITLYDTMGRVLYNNASVNSTKTIVTGLQLQQQVVIAEVNTTKGKVSKRIVF